MLPTTTSNPKFGMLIKISGKDAAYKKHGVPSYPLASALMNVSNYEKTTEPGDWELGYYRDPDKPSDIWMASDEPANLDKTLLDSAKRKSDKDFERIFQYLKNKVGIKNAQLPLGTSNDSRFVKTGGSSYALETSERYADAYEKDRNPFEWNLGYYRDPEKPKNVWVADGNARAVLDDAMSESKEKFSEVFKALKKVDAKR